VLLQKSVSPTNRWLFLYYSLVQQTLGNLPPADCNGANFASCNTTFISTVAETLSLNSSSVQSVSFNKVFSAPFFQFETRLTRVSYVVSTESATETFDSLTNTLVAAINAGNFTTMMHGFAGSNALSSAIALSQADGGKLKADNKLDSSDGNELSGGEIAGIVIGIVAFVALLGAGIYFMLMHKQSDADHVAGSAKPVPTKELDTV